MTVKAVPRVAWFSAICGGSIELAAAALRQQHAQQAPPVLEHEVDHLGGDLLGGADEVALVLAVGVVGHDDHPAGTKFGNQFLDGAEHLAHLQVSKGHGSY